jgi:hypothetical protein
MISRLTGKTLNKNRCVFTMLFVPVVLLHLAWITPMVEWSCFCPDDEPNHQCCCNCPKCIKNRGGFKSFCHLRPERVEETNTARGSANIDLFSSPGNALAPESCHGPHELSICQCDSHITKISLDIKPFLPQALISSARPCPVIRIIPTDDWMPPGAIPCQPHPPG